MKSIRNLLWPTLLTAGAALTAAGGVSAASAADEATAPQTAAPQTAAQGWHHHGGPWHLLGKLNLSASQKQQIKDIMTTAHPQMQSLHEQMRANMQKLQQTAPTDPNYSSIASQVGQTHGSLAAQALTQRAELRAQVFKVLTPAQQSQLTALEAEMRSHKHGGWGGGPDAGAVEPAP
jgi:periplasmic protein CpxP/Spy